MQKIWRITHASILNGCRITANISFRPIGSQYFKFCRNLWNMLKIRTIWCITHVSMLTGCQNTANISFRHKKCRITANISFRPIRSQYLKFAVKYETRWKYERFGVLHMFLCWTVAEIQKKITCSNGTCEVGALAFDKSYHYTQTSNVLCIDYQSECIFLSFCLNHRQCKIYKICTESLIICQICMTHY